MTTYLRKALWSVLLLLTLGAWTASAQTPYTITTPSPLPNGFLFQSYAQQFQTTGGLGFEFWFTSTQPGQTGLPGGLNLDSSSGLLSGVPNASGTFTFRVNAQSFGASSAGSVSTFKDFAITINSPVSITSEGFPDARVGVPYSTQVSAVGGTGTITFAVTGGALPGGLTLSPAGVISGIPTGPPNADAPPTFTITATDQATPTPSQTSSRFQLRVFPPFLVFTATSPLPNGVQGAGYSYSFGTSVAGGVPPYFFSTRGPLPPGLTLNSTTGLLSGTIAANAQVRPYNFTVGVSDSGSDTTFQSVAGNFTLNVKTSLVITTTTLPVGAVNQNYNATLTATGGDQPSSFTVTAGGLPPGLSLGSGNTITGVPTTAGTFPFTVTAADAGVPNQQFASQQLSIRIAPALVFTTASPLPAATQNVQYSTSIATANGSGFVLGQITTNCTGGPGTGLPPGLNFSSSGLTISGTPTTAGNFSFCVQATDFGTPTQTISSLFQLAVQPPLVITTTSPLPNGTVSQTYSQQIVTTGGLAPLNFTISAGTLPPGITISSTGMLNGNPTTAGVYNFTVQVTDSIANTPQVATRPYQLTIQPQLIFTQTTLPTAVNGSVYSVSPLISGGVPPYTVTVTSGALPPGLSIDSTGNLTGTPTATGSFPFALRVVDNGNPAQTINSPFTIVVNAPLSITTTSPLLPALRTIPYTGAIAATGGLPPYSFTVTAGALPPGLLLSSTGQITGTATQLGVFTFTVTATDSYSSRTGPNTASRQFTIGVFDPVVIQPTSLPNGIVSTVYNASLTATGGTPPYQFAVVQGSLPLGLSLSSNGQITGVPLPNRTTSTTAYSFRVRAVDSTNSPVNLSGVQDYTITISPQALSFSLGPILPSGTAGRAYAVQIGTVGGSPPVFFSVTSGALPSGLALEPATGQITGTPSAPGQSSFTITARDSANPATAAQVISQAFSITIGQPRVDLQISSNTTLPEGTVDTLYLASITATGGQPPYSFRLNTGNLPEGLSLSADGSITGTPKRAGTFTFGVLVGDTSNVSFSGAFFTIKINPAALVISGGMPNGIVGQPYSGSVSAAGGVPPYRFSISGLPPGVTQTLNNVGGTPTTAGTFAVTVVVTDSLGTQTTKTFTVVISSALRLTTTAIPDGTVGQAYTVTLAATGGTPPYVFAVSGTLPDGLTIDTARGTISGTPTVAGAINIAVQVTDQSGQKDSRNFTAAIVSTLVITTNGPLTSGTVGTPYSGSLAASGGTPPYTFSGSGAGLTVAANGSLSGTPDQAGDFTINATVKDANGLTASKSLAITIRPASTTISVSGSVGGGTVGTAYTGSVSASGGTAPFTFSISSGSLPPGVQLTGANLSGTPTAAGSFTFTVQATDQNGQTGTATFTAVIGLPPSPPVTITGPGNVVQPQQQPVVGVTIGAPFPVDITGTMTLLFTPDVVNSNGGGDPAVQFATGGLNVNFTIPAGQTQAVFPVNNLQIQTGTTAGTITLRVSLQASGTTLTPPTIPDRVIQVPRSAPVITSLRVTRTATGFTIDITGFSSPREVTSGSFTFTAAAGNTLQTSTVTVQLGDALNTFYRSPASQPFGSQFTISVPFNVTQGTATAINGVTVTLTNSVGPSAPVTASF